VQLPVQDQIIQQQSYAMCELIGELDEVWKAASSGWSGFMGWQCDPRMLKSICEWSGVSCSSETIVTQIAFSGNGETPLRSIPRSICKLFIVEINFVIFITYYKMVKFILIIYAYIIINITN
jgi:hypothetical protein